MHSPRGIQLAVDLARTPALFRLSSSMALPDDISEVIRIASGDEDACRRAALITGERVSVLVESARLYLKQILFRPDADCWRVLGVSPGASKSLARDHMRLLLIWLHPDHNQGAESVFANRVVRAWREFSLDPQSRDGRFDQRTSRTRQRRMRPLARLPLIRIRSQAPSRPGVKFWTLVAIALIGVCAFAATTKLSEQVTPASLGSPSNQ